MKFCEYYYLKAPCKVYFIIFLKFIDDISHPKIYKGSGKVNKNIFSGGTSGFTIDNILWKIYSMLLKTPAPKNKKKKSFKKPKYFKHENGTISSFDKASKKTAAKNQDNKFSVEIQLICENENEDCLIFLEPFKEKRSLKGKRLQTFFSRSVPAKRSQARQRYMP